MLKDEKGEPAPVYSIASGLDYPSVGPEHAFLHDMGRIQYETVGDEEAMEAFFKLSRYEGIIPAIESSHAVAYAMKKAKEMGLDKVRIVCRDINIGSNKTILANSGVYVDMIHGEVSGMNINRYDIPLS